MITEKYFTKISMQKMPIKDRILYSTVVFLIVIAGVLILFSVFNLYKTLTPNWAIGLDDDTPNYYTICQKFDDSYELTVDINTFDKKINDVTVQLVSNGGMTADKEKIEIPSITPDSSDIAIFTLTGEPTKSLAIRVSYVIDNFWKDEFRSSVVTPDYDCLIESPKPVLVE